jgi:uncharacterized alkaline shock family protein YloU
VVEYGVDIHTVVEQLKQQLAAQILLMTGRRVIEVNVEVIDIQLPEDENPQEVATSRVR